MATKSRHAVKAKRVRHQYRSIRVDCTHVANGRATYTEYSRGGRPDILRESCQAPKGLRSHTEMRQNIACVVSTSGFVLTFGPEVSRRNKRRKRLLRAIADVLGWEFSLGTRCAENQGNGVYAFVCRTVAQFRAVRTLVDRHADIVSEFRRKFGQ